MADDFSGFKVPEMDEATTGYRRFLSRLPYRSDIVAVVPTSTTGPSGRRMSVDWYRLSKNYHARRTRRYYSMCQAARNESLILAIVSPARCSQELEFPEVPPSQRLTNGRIYKESRWRVLWGLGFGDLIQGNEDAIVSRVSRSSGFKTLEPLRRCRADRHRRPMTSRGAAITDKRVLSRSPALRAGLRQLILERLTV